MKRMPPRTLWIALVAVGSLWGCASTKAGSEGNNPNVLTREQIMDAGATNLFDVVSRLRPQWLTVRTTRSFNLDSSIVVFQNDMHLGGPDALRQVGPELAYELRWVDGVRAAAMMPSLASGRHVEGAIIVSTRPPGGE